MKKVKNNEIKTKLLTAESKIVFKLKTDIYPLEAIYNTTCLFMDKAYMFIDGDAKKEITVELKGKEKLTNKDLTALKGEFCNELLNNVLRLTITTTNQKIREFVIGTALVSCLPSVKEAVQDDTFDDEDIDWQEDPLGIAIPWDEKNSKNK